MKIPVIYYHSVAPEQNRNWVLGFLTLELKYFQDQIRYFIRRGYDTLFLKDYIDHKKKEKEFKSKSICLTFDDGYLDNWIYVYPLLKKYKIKATILISPEFVDPRPIVRKNLEDYWKNKTTINEIDQWGFLSWEEMMLMEKSGWVDIQSHTMTHTKYFASDNLIDFHHPGSDSVYLISNHFPKKKPFYIGNPEFEKLIPFGYPKFEEKSAILARRVFINEEFNREVVDRLRGWDWGIKNSIESAFDLIKQFYLDYKNSNRLIVRTETETEFQKRVIDELKSSKEIIEKQLGKRVSFCGWPHGDNNDFLHQMALKLGYRATMAGRRKCDDDDFRCIPRFGLGKCKNNRILSTLKNHYKINSFQGKFPYYQINKSYRFLKHGKERSSY